MKRMRTVSMANYTFKINRCAFLSEEKNCTSESVSNYSANELKRSDFFEVISLLLNLFYKMDSFLEAKLLQHTKLGRQILVWSCKGETYL